MEVSQTTTDRRVRRSRAALMRVAVDLVAERGTTNIAVSDLADAADVSRQLVYQQYGDRDSLLLEAALDLAEREFLPHVAKERNTRARVLAAARHFAQHRSFYRAMLTGPCAYRLTTALSGVVTPLNRQSLHRLAGARLSPDLLADLATFVTGGWGAVFNTWVIEGPDPLDAEAFADRLMRMLPVVNHLPSKP